MRLAEELGDPGIGEVGQRGSATKSISREAAAISDPPEVGPRKRNKATILTARLDSAGSTKARRSEGSSDGNAILDRGSVRHSDTRTKTSGVNVQNKDVRGSEIASDQRTPDEKNRPSPCQGILDVLIQVDKELLDARRNIIVSENKIDLLEQELTRLKDTRVDDIDVDEQDLERMKNPPVDFDNLTDLETYLGVKILRRLSRGQSDRAFRRAVKGRKKRLKIEELENMIAKEERELNGPRGLRWKEGQGTINSKILSKRLSECEARNKRQ